MQNTVPKKPVWRMFAGCLLAGFASFIVLWMLVNVEAFQAILLAPLGAIHKMSWALLGYKIIPDGVWSTLYVSAYFFALGPLIVALVYWRKSCRHAQSFPDGT